MLLANSGIYMFPDSLAETPGSFVGIVLSSELPAADQETFKDLLNQLTDFRLQVKRVQWRTACCLLRRLCCSSKTFLHAECHLRLLALLGERKHFIELSHSSTGMCAYLQNNSFLYATDNGFSIDFVSGSRGGGVRGH